MFSIAATEDLPQWRRFADQLGRFTRLITFDPRDIGLSNPLHAQPDLDSWVSDATSVRESSRGASPAHAAAIWSFIGTVDVREMALALDLPVLVLTAVGNRLLPSRFGDWLASNIAGARSVNLPGGDHLFWATSSDRTMIEIEDFLAGARSRASGTSALVAIVFTDIVESTAQNVEDGDHEWIRRLDQDNDLAEQQVRRFGGTTIKRTGDGVLGLGVTIAARALSHAAPGQLVARSTVVESVAGSSALFEPLGAHDFKGVPRPWSLVAVTIESNRRT